MNCLECFSRGSTSDSDPATTRSPTRHGRIILALITGAQPPKKTSISETMLESVVNELACQQLVELMQRSLWTVQRIKSSQSTSQVSTPRNKLYNTSSRGEWTESCWISQRPSSMFLSIVTAGNSQLDEALGAKAFVWKKSTPGSCMNILITNVISLKGLCCVREITIQTRTVLRQHYHPRVTCLLRRKCE